MEIREARTHDRPAIRDVARRSLQASYSLDPSAITGAIEKWYDEGRMEEALSDKEKLLLVGTVDEQIVGFSESIVTGDETAQLLWLHIDPFYRGENYGQQLFDVTRERLGEQGIDHFQGRVLADNQVGAAFYEQQGFSRVGEGEVNIEGVTHIEYIYADIDDRGVEEITVDGMLMYIDYDTSQPGSLAPFSPVYTDSAHENLYGQRCSNCGEVPVAMDTMGRLRCDECSNTSRPTRWDAAYL